MKFKKILIELICLGFSTFGVSGVLGLNDSNSTFAFEFQTLSPETPETPEPSMDSENRNSRSIGKNSGSSNSNSNSNSNRSGLYLELERVSKSVVRDFMAGRYFESASSLSSLVTALEQLANVFDMSAAEKLALYNSIKDNFGFLLKNLECMDGENAGEVHKNVKDSYVRSAMLGALRKFIELEGLFSSGFASQEGSRPLDLGEENRTKKVLDFCLRKGTSVTSEGEIQHFNSNLIQLEKEIKNGNYNEVLKIFEEILLFLEHYEGFKSVYDKTEFQRFVSAEKLRRAADMKFGNAFSEDSRRIYRRIEQALDKYLERTKNSENREFKAIIARLTNRLKYKLTENEESSIRVLYESFKKNFKSSLDDVAIAERFLNLLRDGKIDVNNFNIFEIYQNYFAGDEKSAGKEGHAKRNERVVDYEEFSKVCKNLRFKDVEGLSVEVRVQQIMDMLMALKGSNYGLDELRQQYGWPDLTLKEMILMLITAMKDKKFNAENLNLAAIFPSCSSRLFSKAHKFFKFLEEQKLDVDTQAFFYSLYIELLVTWPLEKSKSLPVSVKFFDVMFKIFAKYVEDKKINVAVASIHDVNKDYMVKKLSRFVAYYDVVSKLKFNDATNEERKQKISDLMNLIIQIDGKKFKFKGSDEVEVTFNLNSTGRQYAFANLPLEGKILLLLSNLNDRHFRQNIENVNPFRIFDNPSLSEEKRRIISKSLHRFCVFLLGRWCNFDDETKAFILDLYKRMISGGCEEKEITEDILKPTVSLIRIMKRWIDDKHFDVTKQAVGKVDISELPGVINKKIKYTPDRLLKNGGSYSYVGKTLRKIVRNIYFELDRLFGFGNNVALGVYAKDKLNGRIMYIKAVLRIFTYLYEKYGTFEDNYAIEHDYEKFHIVFDDKEMKNIYKKLFWDVIVKNSDKDVDEERISKFAEDREVEIKKVTQKLNELKKKKQAELENRKEKQDRLLNDLREKGFVVDSKGSNGSADGFVLSDEDIAKLCNRIKNAKTTVSEFLRRVKKGQDEGMVDKKKLRGLKDLFSKQSNFDLGGLHFKYSGKLNNEGVENLSDSFELVENYVDALKS